MLSCVVLFLVVIVVDVVDVVVVSCVCRSHVLSARMSFKIVSWNAKQAKQLSITFLIIIGSLLVRGSQVRSWKNPDIGDIWDFIVFYDNWVYYRPHRKFHPSPDTWRKCFFNIFGHLSCFAR